MAWEYLRPIVVAIALVFGFMRPFVVEPFQIPAGSMEDALLVGDRILVCKFIYGVGIPGTDIKLFDFHEPARGDVFVFVPLHQKSRHFIKRIVAIGGDTVETKVARSTSTASRSKMALTQNVCPAASAPATIFPLPRALPFARQQRFCRLQTLARTVPCEVSGRGAVQSFGRARLRHGRQSRAEQRQPHLGHRPSEPNQRGAFMVSWSYDLLNPKKPWQIWKMIDDQPI